jgi:hypothetical protein
MQAADQQLLMGELDAEDLDFIADTDALKMAFHEAIKHQRELQQQQLAGVPWQPEVSAKRCQSSSTGGSSDDALKANDEQATSAGRSDALEANANEMAKQATTVQAREVKAWEAPYPITDLPGVLLEHCISFIPTADLGLPGRTCKLLKGIARAFHFSRGPERVARLIDHAAGNDLTMRKWALGELEKAENRIEWIALHASVLARKWGCCPHTARVMKRLDLAALTPLAEELLTRFVRVYRGIQDQTEAEAMAELVMTLRPLWPLTSANGINVYHAMLAFQQGRQSPLMASLTAGMFTSRSPAWERENPCRSGSPPPPPPPVPPPAI